MDKEVKKALLTAIGVASIAREKAEKIAKDVVKTGILSKKETKRLVEGFLKKAESESVRIHKILKSQVGSVAAKAQKRGKKIIKKAAKKYNKKGKKILRKLSR